MNPLRTLLETRPELARLPVTKRERSAVHFGAGREHVALFTGQPLHVLSGDRWHVLDTALQPCAGDRLSFRGSGVRVTRAGLVEMPALGPAQYVQQTRRIGLVRPGGRFRPLVTLPEGMVDDARIVQSGGMFEHVVHLTETGIEEVLTITDRPAGDSADWLVMETMLPLGWPGRDPLRGSVQGLLARAPRGADAAGRVAPVRRWLARDRGLLCVFTGVPLSWLAGAAWPVVIDPDFTGNSADGMVTGSNGTYATARGTSTGQDASGLYQSLGQQLFKGTYDVWRCFLKFVTSSIGAGSTVTAVTLTLTAVADSSVTNFDVQIVDQDWSGQDPLTAGNREAAYDNCLLGTADASIWRNTSGMSINTPYTSGALSTAWVSVTGNTYYSLRSSRDYGNNTPTGLEYISVAMSENGTPSYRPVLSVTYTDGRPRRAAEHYRRRRS